MKVEKLSRGFDPITITLENVKELSNLNTILEDWRMSSVDMNDTPTFNFASSLYTAINKAAN